MSEVSSRPRVRSVASRAIEDQILGSASVGTVVAAALGGLSCEAFAAAPSIDCPQIKRLMSSPQVAAHLEKMRVDAAALVEPTTTTLLGQKAAALLALAQTPLVVRPGAVTAHVECLMEASSLDAVRQAEVTLVEAAKSEHALVMGEALAASCRRASIDAGFIDVVTTTGPRGDLRVVATDASGRALVSEIHRGDDTHAPSVETEVVGFADGRCHAILDRFDEAMEAHGVRTDGSPKRKSTGGVCELSLARDFIRKRVAPVVPRHESPRPVGKRSGRGARTVNQGGR